MPLRVLQCSMSSHEVLRQLRTIELAKERDLRVTRRDDDRRQELLAVRERHAAHTAVHREHAVDRRLGPDLRAERPGRAFARLGDGAHPAFDEPPARDLAVADVAHRVVHQHVGGPRRVRPGPGTDDAVHRLEALHLGRFEPTLQQIGRAHREQPGDVGDRTLVDMLAERPSQLRHILDVVRLLRTEVRRGLHQHRPQDVGDPGDPRVERVVRVGVLLGETFDRRPGLRAVFGLDDRTAAAHRQIALSQRQELEPVSLELQVAPHGGRHQRHRVAERVDLHAGKLIRPRLHRVGRPSGLVSLLTDDDPSPVLGQVRGSYQAVMTPADHDRVVDVRRH